MQQPGNSTTTINVIPLVDQQSLGTVTAQGEPITLSIARVSEIYLTPTPDADQLPAGLEGLGPVLGRSATGSLVVRFQRLHDFLAPFMGVSKERCGILVRLYLQRGEREPAKTVMVGAEAFAFMNVLFRFLTSHGMDGFTLDGRRTSEFIETDFGPTDPADIAQMRVAFSGNELSLTPGKLMGKGGSAIAEISRHCMRHGIKVVTE